MPHKIPTDFIDLLLARIDIVEIIAAQIPIKKAGQDYKALCPFHNEKTPSFTVSPNKQFYYCFGCGAHGTAIGFLMQYKHLDFHEAIADLATEVGLEVPTPNTLNSNQYTPNLEPSYTLLAKADAWFQHQLRTHPNAVEAIAYLKGRGLTGEIAAYYGIGYAPPGWNNLQHAFHDMPPQLLFQNGLLAEKTGNYYDRFRQRIIFPIRNRKGRTIGFGGRVLNENDKPKYLNSPETPLFHKSQELYGLFEARQKLQKIDTILVVEGYMDVIALAQFGIHNAVATLGTATTLDHLQRLFRVTKHIVFCFDGDQAGREAAWKAIKVALPIVTAERTLGFLFLPDGEDPDTFVRQVGNNIFEQYISNAKPFSTVFFEHLKATLDLNTVDGRARLAEQARPFIGQIPSGVYREMLIADLEKLTGLSKERLGIQEHLSNQQLAISKPADAVNNSDTQLIKLSLEQRAFAILIQNPTLAPKALQIDPQWRQLQWPDVVNLGVLLDYLQAQPELTTAALIERWRPSQHFEMVQQWAQYDFDGNAIKLQQQELENELIAALQSLNYQMKHPEKLSTFNDKPPSRRSEEEKEYIRSLTRRF